MSNPSAPTGAPDVRNTDGWRSIESHPKDGTCFVVCDVREDDGFMKVVRWEEGEDRLVELSSDHFFAADSFTHWYPVLAMPKPNSG
jgi:hypothetical protein